MSCVNLISQLLRMWIESAVVEESFTRYTMLSMLGCPGWVPFLEQIKGAAFKTTTVSNRRLIPFAELSGALPGHKWTGLRLPIPFRFSTRSAQQMIQELGLMPEGDGHHMNWEKLTQRGQPALELFQAIPKTEQRTLAQVQVAARTSGCSIIAFNEDKADWSLHKDREGFSPGHNGVFTYWVAKDWSQLGMFGDGGSNTMPFKIRLGNSCDRLCLQDIVQLLLLSRSRISVDFQHVDWHRAIVASEEAGRLEWTGKVWRACLADGEPVLKRCLLQGSGCSQEKRSRFDLMYVGEKLLELRADPNAIDADYQPLLLACAMQGQVYAAKVLLSYHADVNSPIPNGRTALCDAIRKRQFELVSELIRLKADTNLKAHSKHDPLDEMLSPLGHACRSMAQACADMALERPGFCFGMVSAACGSLIEVRQSHAELPETETAEAISCVSAALSAHLSQHRDEHEYANNLKAELQQALEALVKIRPLDLLQWQREDGDTVLHLVSRAAPCQRHTVSWLKAWLQPFPDEQLSEYTQTLNRAASTALEEALRACNRCDDFGNRDETLLAWLLVQLERNDAGRLQKMEEAIKQTLISLSLHPHGGKAASDVEVFVRQFKSQLAKSICVASLNKAFASMAAQKKTESCLSLAARTKELLSPEHRSHANQLEEAKKHKHNQTPAAAKKLKGGTKLLDFRVRGSKPGREFSAEIGALGNGVSVRAQVAKRDQLPVEWRKYCVYVAQAVLEYHNDEGPEHNIHLNAAVGVRLLGQNVLPNAEIPGVGWDRNNPRWRWLQGNGNLHWRAKYVMALPDRREEATSKRLLEFGVRGSTPGRRFSASVLFQDDKGREVCNLTLLDEIILPTEWTTYCFDVEQAALTYHNDEGCDFDIHIDTAMGVCLLGQDVLPSAISVDSGWAPDDDRWRLLRECGNLQWQGRYEMKPSSNTSLPTVQSQAGRVSKEGLQLVLLITCRSVHSEAIA
ncbi:unnamed protein product [Symbiodinium sp. CCMP2592]|nr:unnamed protein product [Symbiodinium sp. CCMP2592]